MSGYSFRFIEPVDDAKYFDFLPVAYTMLKTLGVRPLIGSDFTEDDARSRRRRVLITYETWQREFGGRLDAVGRTVWGTSAEMRYEIAGVLPEGFIPPHLGISKSWSGIAVTFHTFDGTAAINIFTAPVIRLKPGVSLQQAQSQMDVIAASLGPEFPEKAGVPASVVRLRPLREAIFERYTTYGALVFAAAAMVLMVGCANLASLLLVRARSREHRAAIQLAIGASRRSLIRAALAEAVVLAFSGSLVALVVLRLASHAMRLWLPPAFIGYVAPVFETRVLLFSLAIGAVSAVLAGALPGWRASRVNLLSVLQRGDGRLGSGRLKGGSLLLAIELALTVGLVVGAVSMGRTLINLKGMDVGFEPERLLTVAANLPPSQDKAALLRQYQEILTAIRGTPGVDSAAGADTLPMVGVINRPMIRGSQEGQRCPATEGLAETLKMHVIAGRTITADDVRTRASVGMLSLLGLKLIWPGVAPQEAVGRYLELPYESPREVIGVVSDVRYPYLAPALPTMYVPISSDALNGMLFAVRTAPGQNLTVADFERRFRQLGLKPKSLKVGVVTDNFSLARVDQTFRARLFAGFGFVAVALAIVGVYAVQSFTVAARRREFGIRVSLGATPRHIRNLLIWETIRPAVVGVIFGLLLAYWASQFLQAFVYGIDARDPSTFVGVAALILAVAVAAVWLPARRASRTDPASVLRTQ